MSTNDTPAPQWAVEAAKEIQHFIAVGIEHGADAKTERINVAAIIARHAPQPPSKGELMETVCGAIQAFPHPVPFPLDLAARIVNAIKHD